jgi:hypothetical protein
MIPKITHNKDQNYYAYINGYYSQIRNMVLISSVGIATIGFSNNFNEYSVHIQVLAVCILVFSIIYGFKANKDLSKYIDHLNKNVNSSEPPLSFQLAHWQEWITLTYLFLMIIIIITIITFKRKIRHHSK